MLNICKELLCILSTLFSRAFVSESHSRNYHFTFMLQSNALSKVGLLCNCWPLGMSIIDLFHYIDYGHDNLLCNVG